MKKQKVVLSVSNDLITDQRVHKVATSLQSFGNEVTLIGRRFRKSEPLYREYKTKRMKLIFNKKVWFYAEYNIRLFIYLLFNSFDIYIANDLDTLLPNFLVSKLKGKKLVYDSHELFCEVPELTSRPRIRYIWLKIEEWVFPKLKNVITVNNLIADIYSAKYKVNVDVIRNIAPVLKNKTVDLELKRRVAKGKKMIILQGSGINIDRGGEELVLAMQYIESSILYIIGSGEVIPTLKKMVTDLRLEDKVNIIARMPYSELIEYTKIADIGVSLDKGTNENYEYSLPNKIFDFIQAEIPILASNRRVVAKLVTENNLGKVVNTHEPKEIAAAIEYMLEDENRITKWKENLRKASYIYNWENESKNLKKIYSNLL